MFKNINLLKTSVVLFGVMLYTEGNADCHTLGLKTLPKAVRSSKDKPPYLIPVSSIWSITQINQNEVKTNYYVCVNFFNLLLKGKNCLGKENDVIEDNLQCAYTLTKNEKTLNAKEPKVVLKTPLSSLKHLTTGKSLCPDLVADHLENFKQNKPIEIEGTHRVGSSFEYELKIATKLGSTSKNREIKTVS